MIKVKMGELLNIVSILNKIGKYDTEDINLQFKLKVALLNKSLQEYVGQYTIELKNLINKYEIGINDNEFMCDNTESLKEFLNFKYELEDTDLELNVNEVKYDKTFNKISGIELIIIMPFFDYSEVIE